MQNQDRIQSLAQRLSAISDNIEVSKYTKLQNLQSVIQVFEQQSIEQQDKTNRKFNTLKDALQNIEKCIEEERQMREQLDLEQSESLRLLEQRLRSIVEQEMLSWKEVQNRFQSIIQEKIYGVHAQLESETRLRNEALDTLQQYLELDLPKLQSSLQDISLNREQTVIQISQQLEEELGILQLKLNEEKKIREEGEEVLLDQLRSVVTKAKNELEKEKSERHNMENQLMDLLDKTCSKLNSAAQV